MADLADMRPEGYAPQPGLSYTPPYLPQSAGLAGVDPMMAPASNPAYPPFMRAIGQGLLGAAGRVASLPQQIFQSSENMRLGGDYNPAPTVEALTMMAGGGAPAARVLGEEGSVAALGLLPKVKDTFGNITTAEYKALDEAGKHVLDLNTSYNAKNKSLYVDWAGLPQSPETDKLGLDQYIKQSANAVGPKEIRSIIGALKQEYPDMQSITGIRISGARKAAEEAKPGSYVADPVLRVRK